MNEQSHIPEQKIQPYINTRKSIIAVPLSPTDSQGCFWFGIFSIPTPENDLLFPNNQTTVTKFFFLPLSRTCLVAKQAAHKTPWYVYGLLSAKRKPQPSQLGSLFFSWLCTAIKCFAFKLAWLRVRKRNEEEKGKKRSCNLDRQHTTDCQQWVRNVDCKDRQDDWSINQSIICISCNHDRQHATHCQPLGWSVVW